jgi:DNA-binding CsgD family transcriptional regulator
MRSLLLFAQGRQAEGAPLLEESVSAEQHPFAVVHFWPLATLYATAAQRATLVRWCANVAARPGARVAQACLALLSDDNAEAAKRYRKLGWPLHEALALERSGNRDAAASIFRACGSVRDLGRLEVAEVSTGGPQPGRGRLSARERQVAEMVAHGWTNRRIAEQMDIREKTVERHLTAIYAKLDVSGRAQLAAYIARMS